MKIQDFPEDVQPHIIPAPRGDLYYQCLGCETAHSIERLLYTCPDCGSVLLIQDRKFDRLKTIPGTTWQRIFDCRRAMKTNALKGIYLYHEFIGPVMPLDAVVWLGEGHTPLVAANGWLQEKAGARFCFKNDGQNPSASFKDRGMASAMSYINYLVKTGRASDILAICASTGDTSAAAALYAAYLKPHVKSAVLLPRGKVTPQQLGQPLGSGADVFEVPGVFDDCMKVVENLADHYHVALLNSKNAWRILGQESYSYEIAQDLDYDMSGKVIFVPIGNAGNITAVMSGFIKFYKTRVIDTLPKIIGVQSEHADPVYRYYLETDPEKRAFKPVTVRPSVAQAAMIGNPVSMPRVIRLANEYDKLAGERRIFVVQVKEQAIMDWELTANRSGHIACTHGGECLAGLVEAKKLGLVQDHELSVLDSTAHALKFAGFQEKYFANALEPDYGIKPDTSLVNRPSLVEPADLKKFPAPGAPLTGPDFDAFVRRTAEEIADALRLEKK